MKQKELEMFTKIDNEIIDLLKKFLNSDQIIIDKEKFEDYSHDELPGLKYYPELVVFPKNTEEVSRVVKLANKFNFPIIPRGGGSGLTGGAVPVYGGCIISLEKMNHILEIDLDNLNFQQSEKDHIRVQYLDYMLGIEVVLGV